MGADASRAGALPAREASQVFLRLSLMAGAGMPLGSAFRAAAKGMGRAQAEAMSGIAGKIAGGRYADEAMLESGLFRRQAAGLVAAGSESGRLEDALSALYAYYARMDGIARRARAALLQPLAMLCMSAAVFVLVCVEILPVFDGVYASMGASLDGLSGALLGFGTWLRRSAVPACAVCAAIVLAAVLCWAWAPLRRRVSGWAVSVFGDAGPFRKLSDARYVQAVSMGLDAGLAPDEACRMAASAYDPGSRAGKRYAGCCGALSGGARLHEAMLDAGILDMSGSLLVEAGTDAGREPDAVREAASMMLSESEAALDRLSGLIEPAAAALGSLLVGATVLSAMLPLLGVMASLG